VTRSDDDWDARSRSSDKTQDLKAVGRSWHAHIGEDEIDSRSRLENCNRLVTVQRFDNCKASVAKIIGNQHAEEQLVFNDKHSRARLRQDCWVR